MGWVQAALALCLAWVGLALTSGGQDLVVTPDGQAFIAGNTYRCSLGRGGVSLDKQEGDGATPAGSFPLREVYYRPDKFSRPPATALPVRALRPEDGWCDEPASPRYNQPVRLPFPASHERLWRDDDLYDLIVVVGYNDEPVVRGRGSAIFLHQARADYGPTAGCLAFSRADLLDILARLGPGSRVVIRER